MGADAEVVARAFAPLSGEPLPVADLVEEYLEGGAGAVAILGPRGSGKTTALAQIAARWPEAVLLDEPWQEELERAVVKGVVVYTSPEPHPIPHLATFRLAPWGDDEIIEYLLLRHRGACASVMSRLGDRAPAAGSPGIWSAVLDALAADATLAGVNDALRAVFSDEARRAGTIALDCTPEGRIKSASRRYLNACNLDAMRKRLLCHRSVQVALGAAEIAWRLRAGAGLSFLETTPVADMFAAAGVLVAGDETALGMLRRIARFPGQQSGAVSLLHAAGAAWKPEAGADLRHALLAGIAWRGADLKGAILASADLRRADLTDAVLDDSLATYVHLEGAILHGATMRDAQFSHGHFAGADLTLARASGARFEGADLEGARLEGAALAHANFQGARLVRANLARANLHGAILHRAILRGADLSGAFLGNASLEGVSLTSCTLAGATFEGAKMREARLGGIHLPGALMARADLSSADLTAAHMPDARLQGAVLRGALLADICWERADLRWADLRRATFHMGSSRSGLVGSVIPSEGSRTGFYTDEREEMHFKSPEQVRKADLRGADLRGAQIAGTDFYLVDLRDARYNPVQEQHFRRCGAILRARV